MRANIILPVMLFLLATGLCAFVRAQPPTVTTDKDNYIPGEWVIITGTGWQSDDSVQLTLAHLEPLPDPYHTHIPWFVKPDNKGRIYYRWFVLDQESGTSFELRALGFMHGLASPDNAVTYFRDGTITSVTVNGSSFCAGQSIIVSYTITNAGGQFGSNNVFTAQLSDSLGSFSSPTNIGTLSSRKSGDINSVIPSGSGNGIHYRIRVTSSNPVITSNPDASDLVIHTLPATPVLVTAAPNTICAGLSSNLNATSTGNTIRWYTTSTGGLVMGTSASGADFPVTPSVTTIYYGEAFSAAGCPSPARTMVTVTVTPVPTITGTISGSVCGSGQVTLGAASSAGTISWYFAASGGVIMGTGTSFITPAITTTSIYYVDATANGCTTPTRSSVTATVNAIPPAPIPGTVSQPTCTAPTGSVVLNGLPATGTWTLTRNPGGVVTSGTGTRITLNGLAPGTYTYTVTNSSGCTSPSSSNIAINSVVGSPGAPIIGSITQPTCTVSTGSVVLNGLPASGTWTITRDPGGVIATGAGTTTTLTGLVPGSYTFTVINSAGCSSAPSSNVIINSQPASPGTPVYSLDCTLGFGHATITVSSPVGTGLEYSLNGGTYQTNPVFTGVANGNYFLTVRNVAGCISLSSIFEVICRCVNPPAVSLSAISGSTCDMNVLTVSGNTFGGTATAVTITEDGAGTVSPSSSAISPFSFTYTPGAGDAGRTVIITVTSNNPSGPPCIAASGTYTLTVSAIPAAPEIGTITSLSCTGGTGSVVLNGLPSVGTWTLNRSPGNVSTSGTGTTTTITGLPAGTFTFTVATDPGCISPSSANAVINPQPPLPTAPVVGAITNPTCAVSTGSVALSGLPSTGTWTLTQSPGGLTRTGTGTSTTFSMIPEGTYTFTVTNSSGCTSGQSENVVINQQPPTPVPPLASSVTPPACTLATGSVDLSGLPSTGTWTLTRYPGALAITGTGTTRTISDLVTGIYNFTVTNYAGCISSPSADVIIPVQPSTPDAPVVETITQPTPEVPAGSVTLSGLPSPGSWIIIRLPDLATVTGTGNTFTMTGIRDGKYTFTVTNSSGCTSPASVEVIISTSAKPVLVITDPAMVCSPATVDLTAPEIKAGSTDGLIYTYWTDPDATIQYNTPASATAGTYYIKGTNSSGYYDIKPVIVTVQQMPVSNAGPDQTLEFKFNTTLEAVLEEDESGLWRADSGKAVFSNKNDPNSTVSSLFEGKNVLSWIVSNASCPADTDKVTITVRELIIPTLITPNGDSKNEFFIINGIETLGKTELIIFDRRGKEVFRNSNYDNKWNGVDYDDNPLPNDTYFFVLKSSYGKSINGYILIRR
jgi:gliding motility-associated-like protein